MEKIKRGCLFIVCCLLAVALPAQTLSEQDIIKKMASAAEKTRTVRADFTQTKYSKMLKNAQTSQGKLFCELPDKLRWEASPQASPQDPPPSPPRGRVSRQEASPRGGLEGVGWKTDGVGGKIARMIMSCVSGKCLTDSKAFQVSARCIRPGEYVAELLPLKKEMKRMYAKLVLHFDVKEETVNEVELYEKNGDRTVIKLHDIRINN
ncbi:MAG: outer membrane lipoprotein carrier protein LolA [Bacteroidaceae bacterium]|nr:outer membrane lipoprotein carrier protein LolA [Bacteroidaceae bacterium]